MGRSACIPLETTNAGIASEQLDWLSSSVSTMAITSSWPLHATYHHRLNTLDRPCGVLRPVAAVLCGQVRTGALIHSDPRAFSVDTAAEYYSPFIIHLADPFVASRLSATLSFMVSAKKKGRPSS
jgi:hypothetical protein